MAGFATSSENEELRRALDDDAEILLKCCGAERVNHFGHAWASSYVKEELELEVLYSKEEGSSLYRFMGVCRFKNMQAVDLMQFLYDLKRRLTWDANCCNLNSHFICEWPVEGAERSAIVVPSDQCMMFRCETRAVGPVSARDFVDINYLRHNLDSAGQVESVISVGGHTPALTKIMNDKYSDVFPESSACVRGVTSGGCGWYCVQEKDSSGAFTGDVIMHYVIHSDLKGWMPSAILNATVGGTYVDFFKAVKESLVKEGWKKAPSQPST